MKWIFNVSNEKYEWIIYNYTSNSQRIEIKSYTLNKWNRSVNGSMNRYYRTKWNNQRLKKKYKIIFIIIEYNCS